MGADKYTLKGVWVGGPVYTMDHEVVPGQSKNIDWLLISFRDNFGLHQRKNGRGTLEVEVPEL